ncbi:hypothetical protein MPSEU_000099600 [Mayamaea pseudoterrestris]|nr:hypothetical protein MPSEU_000099600 [Mayamaea pseudoterrestris]
MHDLLNSCRESTRDRYRFVLPILFALVIGAVCGFATQFVAIGSQSNDEHTRIQHGPTKRAILLSSQDSGSGWLKSVLDGVDGVSFQGERMIGYSYQSNEKWLKTSWTKYQRQLEEAFGSRETKGLQLVGFKLMYDQLPQPLLGDFAEWLNDNEIYVIHLRRRAVILQISSHVQKIQAMLSGSMKEDHVRKKKMVVQYPKVQFDAEKSVAKVNRLEKNQQAFAQYLHVHAPKAPQFELWYELLDGPHKNKWFNALFAFLELDTKMTDIESDLIKVGKRRCEDRVDGLQGPNYDNLVGLDSQVACAMLYMQSDEHATQLGSWQQNQSLFYPPAQDKCRLTPALDMKCIDPTYNASSLSDEGKR